MINYWKQSIRHIVFLGLIPLLLGSALSVWACGWRQEATAFAENLQPVEARILGLEPANGILRLQVEYLDEAGVRYQRDIEAASNDEVELRAAGKINMVYDRRNPRNSQAGHVVSVSHEVSLATGTLSAGVILALLGISVSIWLARVVSQIGWLFRNGQAVQTEVRDSKLAPGKRVGRFTYAFRGPNGRWFEGKSPEMPASELANWPVGRKVQVVYDPRDPRRTEPDVFGVMTTGRVTA